MGFTLSLLGPMGVRYFSMPPRIISNLQNKCISPSSNLTLSWQCLKLSHASAVLEVEEAAHLYGSTEADLQHSHRFHCSQGQQPPALVPCKQFGMHSAESAVTNAATGGRALPAGAE